MARQSGARGHHSRRGPQPTNARELAFDVLRNVTEDAAFVTQRLDERLDDSSLSPPDRRLATELVYGAMRRQLTLDTLLMPLLRRPEQQLQPGLRALLRLGAYQLAFLPDMPTHAAVHATVEVARWAGEQHWTGFVNGVLRALDRSLTPTLAQEPGADRLPLTAGQYRILRAPVLPDPQTQPAEYVSVGFSLPEWLVARWRERMEFGELVRLGFWFNQPAPLSLRVNRLRGMRDEYLEALAATGIAARAGELEEAIWLEGAARIRDLPGFETGLVSVQDESAMHAAHLLDPQPGETVLDLCAAPGGKTTHLAERMQNRGRIVAVDVQADRLQRVSSACARLGISIVEAQVLRDDLSGLTAELFDAVLVDVPCSNTGVLGKRPDARWRIQPRDLEELPAIQQRLLRTALSRVKPGGRVLYSTCSLEPEENEQVVRAVMGSVPGIELVSELSHVPGRPADGGYMALLRRALPKKGV